MHLHHGIPGTSIRCALKRIEKLFCKTSARLSDRLPTAKSDLVPVAAISGRQYTLRFSYRYRPMNPRMIGSQGR